MKNKYAILIIMFLIPILLVGCTSSEEPITSNGKDINGASDVSYLSYGGCAIGSAAYMVTLAHTSVWNKHIDGLYVTAEASGCGIDNLNLTNEGVFQIGHAASNSIFDAWNGEGPFEKPLENIRTLVPLYAGANMVIVLENSPIKTYHDLKGKRVSLGVKGGTAEIICDLVMKEGYGLTEETYDLYNIPPSEAADGLKDGSLDAINVGGGIPSPTIMELQATHPVRVLPVEPEIAEKIYEKYPFMIPGVIPEGTHEGHPEVPAVRTYTIGYVNKDLPEDLVYEMTKAIWENIDELAQVHVSQKDLDPSMIKSVTSLPVPLHPGAERYYKEKGWLD